MIDCPRVRVSALGKAGRSVKNAEYKKMKQEIEHEAASRSAWDQKALQTIAAIKQEGEKLKAAAKKAENELKPLEE